jgi:hypothetical protein
MSISPFAGVAGFAAILGIIQSLAITVLCITAIIFLIKKMNNK